MAPSLNNVLFLLIFTNIAASLEHLTTSVAKSLVCACSRYTLLLIHDSEYLGVVYYDGKTRQQITESVLKNRWLQEFAYYGTLVV